MSVLTGVVGTTDLAILIYFLVLNSFYAVLLLLSIPEIWEQTRLAEDEDFQRLMQSDALPPITILVPAYNESATIETSVTAILTLEYRNYEVVVVNDGSKDGTMEQLRHAFDLYEIPRVYPETIETKPLRALYRSRSRSRLLVLDKENGGKADSLNAAINASRFPLVIAVDADTLIEPDALLRLTRPFLLGREIAAVGGTVRVANNCTVKDGRVTDARVPAKVVPGIQVVEYLRAFLFGRLGWNRLGGNLIISGAFGLFRKEYVMAVGGYHTNSIVEDLDLVVRMHRYLRRNKIKYEMPFIPDPVAWTEVPESFKILSRQRERWHRGLIAAMWQYKTMLFNPRYGRIGFLAHAPVTVGGRARGGELPALPAGRRSREATRVRDARKLRVPAANRVVAAQGIRQRRQAVARLGRHGAQGFRQAERRRAPRPVSRHAVSLPESPDLCLELVRSRNRESGLVHAGRAAHPDIDAWIWRLGRGGVLRPLWRD